LRYLKVISVAALLLVVACNSTNKSLVYAESVAKDQDGMRVEGDAGSFSGGVNIKLENVGKFIKIPTLYKGAVPPGWVSYEQEPTPTPPTPDSE